MKTTKLITTAILIIVAISIFSTCKKDKIEEEKPLEEKRPLEEILIEHKWRLDKIELYDRHDELFYVNYSYVEDTLECSRNTYYEFLKDSIYKKYLICYDTIFQWKWYISSSDNYSEIVNLLKTYSYTVDTTTYTISEIMDKCKVLEYSDNQLIFRRDSTSLDHEYINNYVIDTYKSF